MTYISVDVDLDEFDDEDLIYHLKKKGYKIDDEIVDISFELKDIAEDIKLKKDYFPKIRELIYNQVGIIL